MKAAKKRSLLYKRAKLTKEDDHIKEYKRYKKYCKYLIKEDKKLHFDKLIKNCTNIKQKWKIVNLFIKNENIGKSLSIKQLEYNGITYTEAEQISNIFNKAFLGVIEKYKEESNYNTNFSLNLNSNNSSCFSFEHINECSLLKVLHNSKNSSNANDLNSIPKHIFDITVSHFSKPLLYYVNKMFKDKIFYDNLKVSKIIPIYKKDCKKDPLNYRPISILPFFSKVFEKLIFDQIMEFLNTNQLL